MAVAGVARCQQDVAPGSRLWRRKWGTIGRQTQFAGVEQAYKGVKISFVEVDDAFAEWAPRGTEDHAAALEQGAKQYNSSSHTAEGDDGEGSFVAEWLLVVHRDEGGSHEEGDDECTDAHAAQTDAPAAMAVMGEDVFKVLRSTCGLSLDNGYHKFCEKECCQTVKTTSQNREFRKNNIFILRLTLVNSRTKGDNIVLRDSPLRGRAKTARESRSAGGATHNSQPHHF